VVTADISISLSYFTIDKKRTHLLLFVSNSAKNTFTLSRSFKSQKIKMKIVLIGYGKMGRAIEEIAVKKKHEIVLRIDIENAADFTIENLHRADVAIEFTTPQSAAANIIKCIDAGIPVVSGTTGWLHQWNNIKQYCLDKEGTLLYASNFSVGVNLFFELNSFLAKLMSKYKEYDVILQEIHHAQKKDAPSGTAITLAEQILQEVTFKKSWVNHISDNPEELEILSERTGLVPGTHKVKYRSEIDDIEIIHTAHSRKGFAVGAVIAAQFVYGKKGIFSMKDVLSN
jgi:4-hydroxy-tetrahydrodipicolinate reductase